MDFRNRHLVVTGGAGALGTAVVTALVEAGAICHVPCIDEVEAHRFRLREHERVVLTVTGSLADEKPIDRLYDGVAPLWGSIHLAGGFAGGPVRETSVATLRQQIDMNLVSSLLCCRAAITAMTREGANKGGRIVNVAARAAIEARSGAGMAAYTASKAAVAALTAALAEEVAKDGILVNAVAPSIMDTPANRAAMPEADFHLWPKVEEVAATVLFLASPENRVTRGAVVPRECKPSLCLARRRDQQRSRRPRNSTRDRNDFPHGRTHQPRHGGGGDDGPLVRIGLVVLFDVIEIVAIIHHQAVRLRQSPLRGVGEPVEPFKPRAVAEVETGDRVDRQSPPVTAAHIIEGGGPQQRLA